MNATGERPGLSRFTPVAEDPAVLSAHTVGRARLLERLVTRIQDAATSGTRAHTLVVGPRGSGKTHLLAVALYRAQLMQKVRQTTACVWIDEDGLALGGYRDLLVAAVGQLAPQRLAEGWRVREDGEPLALERLLDQELGGRSLVLVLENLDRVFAALGPSGTAALRGYVESGSRTLVLASAPAVFPGVSRRDEPWFGSFDAEHLDDLSGGDLEALIGSTTLNTVQLAVLRHLTGGAPRTWLQLRDAMARSGWPADGGLDMAGLKAGPGGSQVDDRLGELVLGLLDELTPHYQQQLWELPVGERRLLAALGSSDGPLPVQALAHRAGVPSRSAATAIRRLERARWVEGRKVAGTDLRATWYELREPLLRLHLVLRSGRPGDVRSIINVLTTWYTLPEAGRTVSGCVAALPAEDQYAGKLAAAAGGDAMAALGLPRELRALGLG